MATKIKLVILLCLFILNIITFVLVHDFDRLEDRKRYLESTNEKVSSLQKLNNLLEGEVDNKRLKEIYLQLSVMEELNENDSSQTGNKSENKYRAILNAGWEIAGKIETGEDKGKDILNDLEKFSLLQKEFLNTFQETEGNLNKNIISISIINEFKSLR